jgi:hypothetical protein
VKVIKRNACGANFARAPTIEFQLIGKNLENDWLIRCSKFTVFAKLPRFVRGRQPRRQRPSAITNGESVDSTATIQEIHNEEE